MISHVLETRRSCYVVMCVCVSGVCEDALWSKAGEEIAQDLLSKLKSSNVQPDVV